MRQPIHPTAERCTRFGNSKACNATLCSFISDYFVIHLLVLTAFYLLSFIYDFPSKCWWYKSVENCTSAHGVWSRVEWDRQKEVIKLLTSVNNKFTLNTKLMKICQMQGIDDGSGLIVAKHHCCWVWVSERMDIARRWQVTKWHHSTATS